MNNQDLNAFALMVLGVLKDTPEFGVSAYMAYLLNREDFDKMLDVYGGLTVRIPTREEFNKALSAIVYYHSRVIMGHNKSRSLRESHLTSSDLRDLESHLDKIDNLMKYFDEGSLGKYR